MPRTLQKTTGSSRKRVQCTEYCARLWAPRYRSNKEPLAIFQEIALCYACCWRCTVVGAYCKSREKDEAYQQCLQECSGENKQPQPLLCESKTIGSVIYRSLDGQETRVKKFQDFTCRFCNMPPMGAFHWYDAIRIRADAQFSAELRIALRPHPGEDLQKAILN